MNPNPSQTLESFNLSKFGLLRVFPYFILKDRLKPVEPLLAKDDPVQESRVGRIFRQTDLKYRFRGA